MQRRMLRRRASATVGSPHDELGPAAEALRRSDLGQGHKGRDGKAVENGCVEPFTLRGVEMCRKSEVLTRRTLDDSTSSRLRLLGDRKSGRAIRHRHTT